MCQPPLSECYDTIPRLRKMPCILRHANVTEQATSVKQVDQHPPPQPEDAVHATEEAVHHLPPLIVVLPLTQDTVMCSPPPPGCCMTCHTPRHRMMMCVLPDSQLAAQAGKAKKVDQNSLPPPEHVSPGLPCGYIVCDGLKVINVCGLKVINETLVTDDQGGMMVSVFLLSHTLRRRFFSQPLPSSPSHLGNPSPQPQDQYLSFLANLLDIPQPFLPGPGSENNHSQVAVPTPRPCISRSPSAGWGCQLVVERIRTGTRGLGGRC